VACVAWVAAYCAVVTLASPPTFAHHKPGHDDGATPWPYGLMLVVGRVEGDFARIMYEADPLYTATQAQAPYTVQVWGWSDEWGPVRGSVPPAMALRGEPDRTLTVVPIPEPKVLVLRDLVPEVKYVVSFSVADEGAGFHGPHSIAVPSTHDVVFTTMSRSSVHGLGLRLLVVSCDRFSQDKDSTLVARAAMETRTGRGYDVMVHMGDQVG